MSAKTIKTKKPSAEESRRDAVWLILATDVTAPKTLEDFPISLRRQLKKMVQEGVITSEEDGSFTKSHREDDICDCNNPKKFTAEQLAAIAECHLGDFEGAVSDMVRVEASRVNHEKKGAIWLDTHSTLRCPSCEASELQVGEIFPDGARQLVCDECTTTFLLALIGYTDDTFGIELSMLFKGDDVDNPTGPELAANATIN